MNYQILSPNQQKNKTEIYWEELSVFLLLVSNPGLCLGLTGNWCSKISGCHRDPKSFAFFSIFLFLSSLDLNLQ